MRRPYRLHAQVGAALEGRWQGGLLRACLEETAPLRPACQGDRGGLRAELAGERALGQFAYDEGARSLGFASDLSRLPAPTRQRAATR